MANHIDTMKIVNVIMGNLLGHSKTKHVLTTSLAAKALDHAKDKHQLVVVWNKHAAASHRDATYLSSKQQEANTKMIVHASDAKSVGATKVAIPSSDTEVLVLAIRCYTDLAKILSFNLALKIIDMYLLNQSMMQLDLPK